MASSPLDNLAGIGQLKIEPPAQAEIDGLVRSGLARLRDAQNASLSIETSCWNLAVGSMQAALALPHAPLSLLHR